MKPEDSQKLDDKIEDQLPTVLSVDTDSALEEWARFLYAQYKKRKYQSDMNS